MLQFSNIFKKLFISLFHTNFLFLHPLKTSKSSSFLKFAVDGEMKHRCKIFVDQILQNSMKHFYAFNKKTIFINKIIIFFPQFSYIINERIAFIQQLFIYSKNELFLLNKLFLYLTKYK